MSKPKFKYNKRTGVYSRILLLSDGKHQPYQNEVMLTPVQIPGYPRNWKEIEEINIVKYFHETLPDDIEYYNELPSDIDRSISSSVPNHIYEILVKKDLNLMHAVLGSGFIRKGKDCIVGFDEMLNPLATVGNDQLGAELKAKLFGKAV
jgi:hypothetical protein